MAKLGVFDFVSLNCFYKGANEDISWNRPEDGEIQFSIESLKKENILLFGRRTYELMVNYWTSKMALENDPIVAEGMNKSEKIVFSNTLKTAGWNKTRLISGDVVIETKRLKQNSSKDMTILGSGEIVTQFTDAALIDEYQLMVYPVIVGNRTPLFTGIKNKLDLKLIEMKTFNSGTVLLCYEPKKKE